MFVPLMPSVNPLTTQLYALVHLIILEIHSVVAILSHHLLLLLNKRHLAILVIHLLVVPMLFAEKSAVLVLAPVSLNILVILTLFVDPNVSSMLTALLRRLVSGISARMLVLVFVASTRSAMLSTMFHLVPAYLVTKEIHSKFVKGSQNDLNLHHRLGILASLAPVDPTVSAVTRMAMLSVHVFQPTLVNHQTVGLNVWSTQNVRMTRLVSIRSVKIHVQTLAPQLRNAESEITVQFAAVNLGLLEIHFLDAIQVCI